MIRQLVPCLLVQLVASQIITSSPSPLATSAPTSSSQPWLIPSLPPWFTYVVYSSALVVLIFLVLTCRCYYKAKKLAAEPHMIANPYAREWQPNASGRTLIDKHSAKPAAGIANFGKRPNSGESASHQDSEEVRIPIQSQSRASYRGNDYGRLDPEAKQRIASIRLEGNLIPILVAKPSAKALKMLGVEEESIARPFDEDIQTRMENVAKRAGGGAYGAGFGTAKLGNQIASGFKERRAKNLEKQQRRKEMEAKNAIGKTEEAEKTDDLPKKQEVVNKMQPGPNKLAAFLASNDEPNDSDSDSGSIDDSI